MTSYYQCASCAKTSEQEHCVITINNQLVCPHCLGAVEFAFSACTVDQPEPSFGYCDGCDELEAELHLMDGDWLCGKCKSTVIAVQEDKAKAAVTRCPQCHKQSDIEGMCINCWEPAHITVADELVARERKARAKEDKTMVEALEDLNKGCTDHWEMIKARVFVTLFLVWVCFAIWGKYNA